MLNKKIYPNRDVRKISKQLKKSTSKCMIEVVNSLITPAQLDY